MNLRELAFFYHNLVIGFNSGISLAKSFESIVTTEKDPVRKKKARYITDAIKRGDSLSSALKTTAFVPLLDLPVIEVGERTGKLSYVFQLLQKNYEVSADAERTIKSGLVMPAFIFVTAVFLPSVPELFTGKISLAAWQTMFDALKIAGHVSGDYDINLASRRIISEVKSGKTLSAAFAAESVMADAVKSCIELGTESGETPRLLNEAAKRMKSDIHSAIIAFSGALPLLIYWLSLAFAGLSILGLYIKSFFSLLKMF